MTDRIAVVDGANIAYAEKSHRGEPKMANIVAVRSALEENGLEPIIVVDASLVYEIDDRAQLETLIKDQSIGQVPADTDADYFVIQMAQEFNGLLISNDPYESYQKEFPWIEGRRVPVMIVRGIAQLYIPKVEETRDKD